MKYYFLTDDSEKSLAPFFSKTMVSTVFFCVLIVSGCMLLLWPRQNLYSYVAANTPPFLFFGGFAATLLVCAYVSLCCGRGELSTGSYYSRYEADRSTHEKQLDFISYGMVAALVHILALISTCLPLLILCAAVACISISGLLKALWVVYTAALFCRLVGFLCYLLWGRRSALGYVLARLVMIAFIFGTYAFAASINPLHVLYMLNNRPDRMRVDLNHAFNAYAMAVCLAIIILSGANHFLVRRSIAKEQGRER